MLTDFIHELETLTNQQIIPKPIIVCIKVLDI